MTVNDTSAQAKARARAHRRKRLQQRQTVIFGSIIAVLLGVALFSGAVWAKIIPAPFSVEISSPETPVAPEAVMPCPPEGAMPVPFKEITVNVFNSTKIAGLGATTGTDLEKFGIGVSTVGNSTEQFLGTANIVVSPDNIDTAYTLLALIPEAQISLDDRAEDIADVIVGSAFDKVRSADEVIIDAEEPIIAPVGCVVPDLGADEATADDTEEPPADE